MEIIERRYQHETCFYFSVKGKISNQKKSACTTWYRIKTNKMKKNKFQIDLILTFITV